MKEKRQTNYKERGQLQNRLHLGDLEKKRDFVSRREKEKKREQELRRLKEVVESGNKDEFNFLIYSCRREGNKALRTKRSKEDTKRELCEMQKLLLQIEMETAMLRKKAASCPINAQKACNAHTKFLDSSEEESAERQELEREEEEPFARIEQNGEDESGKRLQILEKTRKRVEGRKGELERTYSAFG